VTPNRYKPALVALGVLGCALVACADLSGGAALGNEPPITTCTDPQHHDGDAIRCGGKGRSMRLYAIDAPEMPGACRAGRQCTPGNPFASRDHLRALTAGKAVLCRQIDLDRYGRKVVQCFAGDIDLSCRMVRDGYAVERYGRLRC